MHKIIDIRGNWSLIMSQTHKKSDEKYCFVTVVWKMVRCHELYSVLAEHPDLPQRPAPEEAPAKPLVVYYRREQAAYKS